VRRPQLPLAHTPPQALNKGKGFQQKYFAELMRTDNGISLANATRRWWRSPGGWNEAGYKVGGLSSTAGGRLPV
jgi:hypothetical protein